MFRRFTVTAHNEIARAAAMDPGALNDELARAHPINDYYERSPLPIRWIERRRLQIIFDMVDEQPGDRLLEVGAGGGHVLRQFRRAQLTAVDVSDVFLEIARRNLQGYNCTFLKGEIATLGLPAATFDKIVCTEVLEHTADPEAILAELARLLAPSGRAIITIPNDPLINRTKDVLRRTPLGLLLGARFEWGGDHYHLHQWRPAEFRSVLSRYFRVEAQRSAPFDAVPIRACFLCRTKT